ncbi:hypothetical protein P3C33_27835 [Mesorhizobium sp. P16.1]|uniref:hypothetical protein n=1 Tax=unclassified Mesorhizobium TaxID=325217 RepID=UPI0021A6181B|nr:MULTISPECIES: hypothetical protein [unclassified Mesorhizobium]MCT2580897.1 hypothetical protein [Mesorhizobium sp. P13.3]MDF3169964.1 hypothetical protein [Mesorhizobium sp. P16.1]MDF3186923.1 hypothetical protein [Mesorhizobium sp. ICCV3110.1]
MLRTVKPTQDRKWHRIQVIGGAYGDQCDRLEDAQDLSPPGAGNDRTTGCLP